MQTPPKVERYGSIIGSARTTRRIVSMLRKAAKADVPVLILGETGSGKDLVATELHRRSTRKDGPFVAVNTGMLTHDLIGSELFGHRKGAFTGATEDKAGRFLEANGGSLFLDEIATMDEATQVALLRVLDTGTFRPIGAKRDQKTDIRLIAATNGNLHEAVADGTFREDLLHRLQVFCIEVPPLRSRPDDIAMLTFHFLMEFQAEFGYADIGIADDALGILRAYAWPGNVRELKNVIAQSAVMSENGQITAAHLPQRLFGEQAKLENTAATVSNAKLSTGANGAGISPAIASDDDGLFIAFGQTLDDVQKAYVAKTLERCENNKTQAAKSLGMSRKTLYDRLARWGLR